MLMTNVYLQTLKAESEQLKCDKSQNNKYTNNYIRFNNFIIIKHLYILTNQEKYRGYFKDTKEK
jgi:hypothetical protein